MQFSLDNFFPKGAVKWERVFIFSAWINMIVGLMSIFLIPEKPLAFQIQKPGSSFSLPFIYTDRLSTWLSELIGTGHGYTLFGNIGLTLVYAGYIIIILCGYQGYMLVVDRMENWERRFQQREIMQKTGLISLTGLIIVFFGVIFQNYTRILEVTKVVIETYRPGIGFYICLVATITMMICPKKLQKKWEPYEIMKLEEETYEESPLENLEDFI